MKNCSPLLTLLLILILPGSWAFAQDFQSAKNLSSSGKNQEAEQMFQQLLLQHPDDPEILIASAYNYSWMGKQELAIRQFKQALAIKQLDVNALIGLGYAFAWDKNYIKSRMCFSSVLRRHPNHMDATKGIAYSYLWQGNAEAAINYFRKLSREYPENPEFYYSEGLAYLSKREQQKAVGAFEKALDEDPTYLPAKFQLQTIEENSAKYTLNALGGYSALSEGLSTFGLRVVHAEAQFDKGWRAKFNFDNTLSLDLMSFALLNQQVSALSVGVVKDWNQFLLTDIDYGIRFFPEGQLQHFVKGAQAFFLPWNFQLKTGGFIGVSQSLENEWMGFVSINFPAFPNLRFEPTYYHLKTAYSLAAEHRVQLGALYRFPSGYELNVYGLWGTSNVNLENRRKNIMGWSVSGLVPITRQLQGQIILRQESSPIQEFSSIAGGLRYQIMKKG